MKEPKLKSQINISDSYTPCYRSTDRVSRLVYNRILNGFFKYLMNLVLQGYEVMLPQGLGSVYIKGRKRKPRLVDGVVMNLPIDWVATKKLRDSNPEFAAQKKVVYHLNEHTNGISYAFKWKKFGVIAENIGFYSFELTRTNKRSIHKLIMEGQEYIVEKH